MKVTANELALKLNASYAISASILKLAVATGQAVEVGKVQTSSTGKGKPSTVYDINDTLTFSLNSEKIAKVEDEEEVGSRFDKFQGVEAVAE